MSRNTDDAALWLQNELPDGATSIRVRARVQGGAMRVLGTLPVPQGGLGSTDLVDAFQVQVQELLDRAAPDAVDVRLEAFTGRRLANSYLYALSPSSEEEDDVSTPAGANALVVKGVALLLKETVSFVRAQTSTIQALGGVTVGLAEHLGEVHVAHQRDRMEFAELLAMAQGNDDDGGTSEMQAQALQVLQQGLTALAMRPTAARPAAPPSPSSSAAAAPADLADRLAKMSDDDAAALLKDPALKARLMGLVASGKIQL